MRAERESIRQCGAVLEDGCSAEIGAIFIRAAETVRQNGFNDDVDGNPEMRFKCLKIMVGERGFEPPTPWSRTRFQQLLNFVEELRF
jgi:hypothetical protein